MKCLHGQDEVKVHHLATAKENSHLKETQVNFFVIIVVKTGTLQLNVVLLRTAKK